MFSYNFDENIENSQIFGDNPSFSFYLKGNDALHDDNNNCCCEQSFFIKEVIYKENESKIFQEKELNFEEINPKKNDEEFYNQKIENNGENEKKGSTLPSSDNSQVSKIHKFETKRANLPSYWRMDMAKKHWKSKISEYAKKELNNLIIDSELPEKLKKTIHVPDSKTFTSNVAVTANARFLNYNMIEIFTIGKETEKLPKQNYETISKILEYFKEIGYDNLSNNLRKLKKFLEMSYEDLIIMFYNSFEFLDFKNNEKTIFYDEGMLKQEKLSLLKDYGLIRLFKLIKKKRKRD